MAIQSPQRTPGPKLSRSTIFPLLGNRAALRAKGHLLPISVTIIFGSLFFYINLFSSFGPTASPELNAAFHMYWMIGLYIAFMVNYYVYEFCGRIRPWWLIVAIVAVTALTNSLLSFPFFNIWSPIFYNLIPGDQWQKSPNFVAQLAGWIFGTGLCEEGWKALPLLVLVVIALRGKGKLAKRIGLFEPLDGILFGVAAGSGFFLAETLSNYVPGAVAGALAPYIQALGAQGAQVGSGEAAYQGLTVLLGRGIPELAGHSAYSGIFGYFIGLAVLRPNMRVRLLALGWLTAAGMHGVWDFAQGLAPDGSVPQLLLGIPLALLVYAFLAATIIKARQISPTRAFNFATVLRPDETPRPVSGAAAVTVVEVPAAAAAPAAARAQTLVLAIGPVRRELKSGMQIEAQLLGAAGAEMGPGPIATVEADPHETHALGLVNNSARAWSVTLPTGKVIELATGKAVRLAAGLTIDFGGIAGMVQAA